MNKSSTKVFWQFVGLSTAIHVMLFVAWSNTQNKTSASVPVQYTINVALSNAGYSKPSILNRKQSQVKKTTHKVKEIKTVQNQEQEITLNSNTLLSKKYNKTLSKAIKNNKLKELNKLLHTAINNNKHYPLSALRLNKEGTVKLTFNLLKNGNINELKVINSSGYHALDNAALKAVKTIQPFIPARQYIASVENFLLDIRFQL